MINDGEKKHLECTYIVPGLYRDIYHTRPEWTHEHPFIEYKNKKSPFFEKYPDMNPGQWSTTMHQSGTRNCFSSGTYPGADHWPQLRNLKALNPNKK